ncbi:hypothetical protein BD410DRAFT_638247 [Rickenella mellea]|uniref:Uncharacterized protein n=1 Tax=Rickenella mellea TaxID=50990 RepID=A0A4Y7QCT0_9AGAM|nr:hypothetical protein BD410DRAFT_638247 [Rickenella mellea]
MAHTRVFVVARSRRQGISFTPSFCCSVYSLSFAFSSGHDVRFPKTSVTAKIHFRQYAIRWRGKSLRTLHRLCRVEITAEFQCNAAIPAIQHDVKVEQKEQSAKVRKLAA